MSIPPDVLLLFNKFLHNVIKFQVKFNVWLDIRETDKEGLNFFGTLYFSKQNLLNHININLFVHKPNV